MVQRFAYGPLGNELPLLTIIQTPTCGQCLLRIMSRGINDTEMPLSMIAGPIDPDLVYLATGFGDAVSSNNSVLLAGLWTGYGKVMVCDLCLLHMPVRPAVRLHAAQHTGVQGHLDA